MNRMISTAILLAALMLPGICQAFNVSGTYNSTEGALTLNQSGDRVSGRYSNDNGELIGLMFNQVLEGFWIGDKAGQRCDTPKHGRYYWGRVVFNFSSNGFSGSWGYCNEVPSRSWNGSRGSGRQGFTPPPASTNDPFAINTDSINIEGAWNSSEGEIRFRQQGNRIAGRYSTDNGEIVGSLQNDTLSGYWIEDQSAERCATPKNGRYYWGRVELRFSGSTFSGTYGHCDGPLKSPWGGDRKK